MSKLYRYIKHIVFGLFGAGLPVSSCRFQPSCSHYCRQAIRRFGLIKGGWICLRRLARCHPFSTQHGPDPLPQS